jgi:RimJ/RimL family protein N-acetyltransferase
MNPTTKQDNGFHHADVLGTFTLRPVDPDQDAALLHAWVTHPRSVFWQMGQADEQEVVRAYREIDGAPGHDAYLGLHDGTPAFLVERYDPEGDPVGQVYAVRPGDLGMHVLVAPTDQPVHGFTRAVFATVMAWLFDDPAVRRVVVEPDARNTAVHELNAWAGFVDHETVRLPGKDALLSFCTRDQYEVARAWAAVGGTR